MPDFSDQLQAALGDRYVLERELGRGGMATVYLAHDVRHKRRVALKVLDPELGAVLGGERFRREIEMAAELQHPHVLPVFDSGEAVANEPGTGWLWYTMPYVEGESLRDRLHRQGRLPIPDALRLAREIAEALDYAHRRGVIHRDVKPGNILLSEGHALVADFGIARYAASIVAGAAEGVTSTASVTSLSLTDAGVADTMTGATLTGTGISLGTPAYMSPEQALGARDLDGRSDQYAVGCVLYEMLAGAPPYTGSSAQAVIGHHLTATIPEIQAVRPEVPPAVASAVARAMAKTPEARFPTTAEFAVALESAGFVLSAGTPARRASPRRLLIGTIALLAVSAIGLGALLWWSGPAPPLDEHLVAVAPFEVQIPELAVWREGMVDYISRNLDGAGPLHTVPPTTVLRRWRGRADRTAATAFGRRTGAGLVVYGQLLRIGRDSVGVVATLLDARRGTTITEARGADLRERVERAADAVTVAILRQAGSTQGIQRAGQRGFESRSPAAVRAALGGEQFYRRGMWDSAIVRYKEAVELDSSFTLAQWRLGRLLARHGEEDPNPFLLRAVRTPGLSWLDSMLITADSIDAALRRSRVPLGLSPIVRLLMTLDEVVWQRRADAEAWYELGEARYHWASAIGTPPAEALHAFEQAIALDSGFAPAYVHSVELKLQEGDPAGALRYFDRLRALGIDVEPGTTAGGQRYLLRAALTSVPIAEDSVTTEDLRAALGMFRGLPDSGATTVSMARAQLRKAQRARSATGGDGDPASLPAEKDMSFAVQVLGYRGHLAEAVSSDVNDGLPSFGDLPILMESALLGAAVPAERVERALRASRATPDAGPGDPNAVRWWGARRDTVALRSILARARRSGGDTIVPASVVLDASAYLALARHDTTKALGALTTLTDSLDSGFTVDLLQRARLLAATGKLDAARRQYSRAGRGDGPLSVVARMELAELAERQGARELALDSYQFVAAIWHHADPVLQPYVARARAGVARLTANPKQ
jgi:eukaryotic-like serine/threonine-protein kinase